MYESNAHQANTAAFQSTQLSSKILIHYEHIGRNGAVYLESQVPVAFLIEEICINEGITNGFADYALYLGEEKLKLGSVVSFLLTDEDHPLSLKCSVSIKKVNDALEGKIEEIVEKVVQKLSIHVSLNKSRPAPKKRNSLRRQALMRSTKAAEAAAVR